MAAGPLRAFAGGGLVGEPGSPSPEERTEPPPHQRPYLQELRRGREVREVQGVLAVPAEVCAQRGEDRERRRTGGDALRTARDEVLCPTPPAASGVQGVSRSPPHPRALSGLSSRPVRGSKRHLPACPPHQAAPGLQAPPAHKAARDQNQGDRGPATPAARSLWAHPHSWNSAPVTDATRVAAAGHPAAIRVSMNKGADRSRVRSPRPAWLRCRG